MPCTIEEADDRMFVHTSDTAKAFSKLLIKTVDSDIVIMAISTFRRFVGLTKLWIEFGVEKYLKYISLHELASKFGKATSQVFLSFSCYQWMWHNFICSRKRQEILLWNWHVLIEIAAVLSKMAIVTMLARFLNRNLNFSRDSLFFYTVIHATQTTWTLLRECYSQMAIVQLKISLRQLVLWNTMSWEQCYKQGSGLRVFSCSMRILIQLHGMG